MMKWKQIAYGLATYLPGMNRVRFRGTGGTISARYCYSVWLRHMSIARNSGLDPCPRVIAELGPGDSLGIGLAGLISGCERYYALDVVRYANVERNLRVFDELVDLFRRNEDIPDGTEFPQVKPYLDDYRFPADVLTNRAIAAALDAGRLAKIREAISAEGASDGPIQYCVPWNDEQILGPDSVDLIYSQAVLEHVDDLERAYRSMWKWLRPGGYLSHQIDFRCHDTATEWNEHWACSDFVWSLIRGRRSYLINRQPHSAHLSHLASAGFRVVSEKPVRAESRVARGRLAARFRGLTDADLTTAGVFIQAVKAG